MSLGLTAKPARAGQDGVAAACHSARADTVTDWNATAITVGLASGKGVAFGQSHSRRGQLKPRLYVRSPAVLS